MNGWLVAGIVLAALALLLSCSVVVYVRITDALRIQVGMLGLRFDVLSPERDARKAAKEKREKEKKKKKQGGKKKKAAKKSPGEEKKQEAKEEDRFLDTVHLILKLIRAIFSPSLYVLRHTRLTGVSVEMAVGCDSADKTALTCAGIGIALNVSVVLSFDQKLKRLSIRPDFSSGRITQNTRFRVKIRLGVIIVGVVGMLIHIIQTFFLSEQEREQGKMKEIKEGVNHE